MGVALVLRRAPVDGVVRNDDPNPPIYSIAAFDAEKGEGDGGSTDFVFRVTRTGPADSAETLQWSVTGGGSTTADDFFGWTLPFGTLGFDIGVTAADIIVPVQGDVAVETAEQFTVTIASPSNGGTIATASAIGSILNDDTLGQPGAAGELDGTSGNDSIVGGEAANVIRAYAGFDTVSGGGGDDVVDGGDDDDSLAGDAGLDDLSGGDGSDTLDGGTGADTLRGGRGDDLYIVDDAGDVVEEIPDGGLGGVDTVRTSIDLDISASGLNWSAVENVELTGPAATVTGNALSNVLTGNGLDNTFHLGHGGDDTADGAGGTDTVDFSSAAARVAVYLTGATPHVWGGTATGNITWLTSIENAVGTGFGDSFYGGVEANVFVGGGGNDYMLGDGGDDSLLGGSGLDALFGEAGNDTLDGGLEADIMRGGRGDDLYVVDAAGDVVQEFWDGGLGGTDTVRSSIDLDISASGLNWYAVENVELTGPATTVTGNGLSNTLTGSGLDNIFHLGAGGGDTVDGGAGSDRVTYTDVASAYDVTTLGDGSTQVTNLASGGVDLLTNVEFIDFTGQTVSLGSGGGSGGASAPAATPPALVNGLGGAAGFGENAVSRNDDGNSGFINLSSVFDGGLDFFGTSYSGLYINTNGNLSFGNSLTTFTPQGITQSTTPLIAPYWADVDTRGGGGQTPTPGGVSSGANLIWYDLDAVNGVFTVTWDDVGYFNQNASPLNAFQVQLIDRGSGNFDIVFRYEDINWTTGDASGGDGGLGGTVSRAGWAAGNGEDFFELPSSGNQAQMLALESSPGNAGTGLWTFAVRNGAVSDEANAIENGDPISIDVLANDGADPETLTVTAATAASGASITGLNVAGGALTYDPDTTLAFESLALGATTTDLVTYTVQNAEGATSTATVTVTVTGINDTPDADPDTASATENGSPVSIDVLVNDSDPDTGDTLDIVSAASSSGATVTIVPGVGPASPTLSYDPDSTTTFESLGQGQTTTDLITYTIEDSQGATASSTVTVTVTGVNDGPVANPDTASATENGAPVSIDVLVNDSDPDTGDTLDIISASASSGATVTIVPGAAPGVIGFDAPVLSTLSYDPDSTAAFESLGQGQTTTDLITYVIDDEQGATASSTVTVTVTGVNDGPVANSDTASATENGSSVSIDVLANDSDPDTGDTLDIVSAVSSSGATVTIVPGSLPDAIGFDPPAGPTLAYDPDSTVAFESLGHGQTTTDLITYVIEDSQGATASSTVTMMVTGVNDGPVAVADAASATEDGPAVLINVLANDSDPDSGDVLDIVSAVSSSGASVSIVPGLILGAGGPDLSHERLSYDPSSTSAFDGLFAGQTATDLITYVIQDSQGATASATVTVTVTGTGDLAVDEDSGFTALGVSAPAGQTTFTVTDIPNASLGAVYPAASETPLAIGDVLTVQELEALRFRPEDDANGNAGRFAFSHPGAEGPVEKELGFQIVPQNDAPQIDSPDPGFVFGTEVRSNSETTGTQSYPDVATLDNGTFVTVWASLGQDGDGWGVYGQRFGVDGSPVGGEFQVHSVTTGHQSDPSVSELGNGGFVVVWSSLGQDGDGWGIFGQIFDAAGTPVGGDFQISATTAGDQLNPSVASLDSGDFVVTWNAPGADGATDVHSRIFTQSTQAPATGEITVNTTTGSAQAQWGAFSNPVAGLLGTDGGYVVVWASLTQDGDSWGVFGQVFTDAGVASGSEFQVNTVTDGVQYVPSVAALANGGFVVTWTSYLEDGSGFGVYGQIYDEGGTSSGAPFLVNQVTDGDQYFSTAAGTEDGGFVILFTSNGGDESGSAIHGRHYDAAGDASGDVFQVNAATAGDQIFADVTPADDGGFFAAWASFGQDGDGFGIYTREVDPGLFSYDGGDVLINGIAVSDVDAGEGDGLLDISLSVGFGTLDIADTDGLTAVTGLNSSNVQLTGTLAEINEAIAVITYSINPETAGSDQLLVQVDDRANAGYGGTQTVFDIFPLPYAVDDPLLL